MAVPLLYYQECLPLPALRPIVLRRWTLTGEAADLGGHDQPVLPDGRPELILHLGERFERIDPNGNASGSPRSSLPVS